MTDARGLSRAGFWINNADAVLERIEKRSQSTWVGQITADAEQAVFVPDRAITVTKVGFLTDAAATAGTMSLVNQGTAGTGTDTVASKGTVVVGDAMQTLTLTSAVDVSDGQFLVFKRTTASAQETIPGGLVVIEYELPELG